MLDRHLADSVKIMVDNLESSGAQYALIGGVAVGIRSRLRATKDADFIVKCPALRLPTLFEALSDYGFTLEMPASIERWQTDRFIVMYRDESRIDWMQPILPVYSAVLDSAEPIEWRSNTLRVATAEGIILTKMLSFRPQDQADIDTLVHANPGQLDLNFIRTQWEPFATGEPDRTAWLEAKLKESSP